MSDTLRAAAQQALEALDEFMADYQSDDGMNSMKHYAKKHHAAITALRAALAAAVAEPVAYLHEWKPHAGVIGKSLQWRRVSPHGDDMQVTPLYAAPPQREREPLTDEHVELPPAYMLAKLQMVMPLFQEARDALTAITEAQRKLRHIRADLGDRMDEAGTFSLDDWRRAHGIAPASAPKEAP